jgi:hypothetical protein
MTHAATTPDRAMLPAGEAAIERIGWVGFPIWRLAGQAGTVADLGRFSALNTFFLRGQRIELPDGRRWRITAVEIGGMLRVVVADERRRRLAMASAGTRNYAIDGPDFAFWLNPAAAGRGRAVVWDLHDREGPVARFTRRPLAVAASGAVPLPAAVLGLLLVQFGIPGEGDLGVPTMRWGT